MRYWRSLSSEGKKALGHIFRSGRVPIQEYTPVYAELEGLPDEHLVFLVDWASLTKEEQAGVLVYLSEKFQAPVEAVLVQVQQDTFVAIRHQYCETMGLIEEGSQFS